MEGALLYIPEDFLSARQDNSVVPPASSSVTITAWPAPNSAAARRKTGRDIESRMKLTYA
jgi:hypothetical protein